MGAGFGTAAESAKLLVNGSSFLGAHGGVMVAHLNVALSLIFLMLGRSHCIPISCWTFGYFQIFQCIL